MNAKDHSVSGGVSFYTNAVCRPTYTVSVINDDNTNEPVNLNKLRL